MISDVNKNNGVAVWFMVFFILLFLTIISNIKFILKQRLKEFKNYDMINKLELSIYENLSILFIGVINVMFFKNHVAMSIFFYIGLISIIIKNFLFQNNLKMGGVMKIINHGSIVIMLLIGLII